MIRKTKLIYLLISFLLLSCSMFQKKKVFESYSVQKDSIVIKDRKNYKKARKYLSIGNRYFQEKNYEKSREYANKAIGLYPDGPSYYLLGINEFEQKKFDKALEAFGKAKDLSPNSEQIRLSYAYCLTSLGKSEEALKEYNKLQKDFPSEPIYPFKAGVLLKELGKNEEAYKTFLSVKAESFSERSQLYMHLGDVCLQLKKYKQADEYFLKAKKENPDLKQVSNSLSASKRAGLIEKGNESLKRKDYDTAIHYFEEAAKKSKEPSIPYLLIANTYLLKEDYSKAEANALRSLKYNPKNRETYLSLASAYSGNGLYSKAIQTLKEALQKTPEHASVYNSLGLAYQNIGQNKQAMLAFLKVKELDPSSQSAYINTGNLFLLEGRYLEARKEYLQAKKLKGKDNADKYLQICDIYIILDAGDTQLRQGNFNKALQEYNKALQLDKGENIIYNAFGRAFFLMNRYKESEKNFLKALSLQADSIPSLQGLVRLYAKTRNPRFSEYKEKLNVLAGKDPLAAIAIGRIYEDEGKLEEAETFYLSILEEAKKKKQNAEAIHYRLGTLYYKMALRENSLKNYDSALGFLSKAEKNNPDIPELAQTRRIIEENKSFLSILPIIEEANEHFNKEDYETAMHHYEKAYKQMKRTSLIIKIADCLIGLGRNEKALALLNHELQKNPESKIELQEAISSYYIKTKDYDKAKEMLDNILKIKPDAYYSTYQLGLLFLTEEKEKAIQYLNRSILVRPGFAPTYIARGIAYYGIGEKGKAREEFERAEKLDSALELAPYNIGVLYFNEELYEEAEKAFEGLVKKYPDFPDPRYHLAYINYDRGNLDKAELHIRKALELKRDAKNLFACITVLDALIRDNKRMEFKEEVASLSKELLEKFPDSKQARQSEKFLQSYEDKPVYIQKYPLKDRFLGLPILVNGKLIVNYGRSIAVYRNTNKSLLWRKESSTPYKKLAVNGRLYAFSKKGIEQIDLKTGKSLSRISLKVRKPLQLEAGTYIYASYIDTKGKYKLQSFSFSLKTLARISLKKNAKWSSAKDGKLYMVFDDKEKTSKWLILNPLLKPQTPLQTLAEIGEGSSHLLKSTEEYSMLLKGTKLIRLNTDKTYKVIEEFPKKMESLGGFGEFSFLHSDNVIYAYNYKENSLHTLKRPETLKGNLLPYNKYFIQLENNKEISFHEDDGDLIWKENMPENKYSFGIYSLVFRRKN